MPRIKRQLEDPPPKPITVAEFAESVYMPWCEEHNRAPEFKTYNLQPIVRILGNVPIKELTRAHAAQFKRERSKDVYRGKRIGKGTVNRGLAVLSHMLTVAIDEELIAVNPLNRFSKLPEPQPKEQCMTLEEERRLVRATMEENLDVGLLTAFIGETGLRLDDALHTERTQLDLDRGFVIKRTSKAGTPVHVPLSDFAIEIVSQIPRIVGSRWLFTQPGTRQPMTERVARGALDRAKKKAKLDWVSFHDLRRYRATQWYIHGVPLKDIQVLLGHKRIETTMLYVKFAPTHAAAAVVQAQKKEQEAAVALAAANK